MTMGRRCLRLSAGEAGAREAPGGYPGAPDRPNTRASADERLRLKQQPGGDIEVYRSATLVQTTMRHNLIDEYRVAVHPIVLGGGTQLFPQGGVSATLQLNATRTLDSGGVSLTYVPTGRD